MPLTPEAEEFCRIVAEIVLQLMHREKDLELNNQEDRNENSDLLSGELGGTDERV